MTPTLMGRWQIRLFLLGTVGVIVALAVGAIVQNFVVPLLVLLYVFVQGVILDLLYQYIITFRWDRDWPTSFQVAAGILEGALLWGLIQTGKLPGVSSMLPFSTYLAQYAITWFCIFVLTQGVLRVLWPDWHYQGGQWLVRRSQYSEASSQGPGFQQPLVVQSPFSTSQSGPQKAVLGQSGSQARVQPIVPLPPVPRGSGPQARVQPITPLPPVPQGSGPQQAVRPLTPTPLVSPESGPQQAVLRQSGPQARVQPITPIPSGPPESGPQQSWQSGPQARVQPVTPIPSAPQPFKCVCGHVEEHLQGRFCPKCGRLAV